MNPIHLSTEDNIKVDTNIIDNLLADSWAVPSDVLMRAAEAMLWSSAKLEKPILDIGCGGGVISKQLFKNLKRIDVGIDTNKEAVKMAKRGGFYKKTLVADATKLPFKEESFSTVVSNSTFEHIKEDKKAVKEVARVLKSGGKFMISVPTPSFEKSLKRAGFSGSKLAKFHSRVEIFHYRRPSDWRKILKKTGFGKVSVTHYFPKKTVKAWLGLFKIATFKPYRRELWSYLTDPRFSKFVPKKPLIEVEKLYLGTFFNDMFSKEGTWIFIVAEKK